MEVRVVQCIIGLNFTLWPRPPGSNTLHYILVLALFLHSLHFWWLSVQWHTTETSLSFIQNIQHKNSKNTWICLFGLMIYWMHKWIGFRKISCVQKRMSWLRFLPIFDSETAIIIIRTWHHMVQCYDTEESKKMVTLLMKLSIHLRQWRL